MRDVDHIIQSIMKICPTAKTTRLSVSQRGVDDDWLWFFQQPDGQFGVQIEWSTGMCPFRIETEGTDVRFTANSIDQAIEILIDLLHIPRSG
jgi:hypothetical protein